MSLKILNVFSLSQLLALGSKLLGGIFLFLIFWFISICIKFLVKRLGNNFSIDKKPIIYLLGNLAKIGVLLMGGITALGSIGVNVSALVASLGISSFALSFAMKDVLSNVLAGIMILLYQPFKTGAHIEIDKLEGTVIDIDLRYITLQTEQSKILIPNASILNQAVILKNNL